MQMNFSGLRRRARRGNTIIEFGLVAIFLVPLFLGTINLGLSLGYNLQVAQIARDAAAATGLYLYAPTSAQLSMAF